MGFLRPLESLVRMLQCLLGMLVPALVIFFPVVRGHGTVRVCGQLVEFGSSLMRVIWHSFPYLDVPRILEPFHFSSCPILNTCAAATLFVGRSKRANGGRSEIKWDHHTGEGRRERPIVSPLCPGECPKEDRRRTKNRLLTQRRITRLKPILGRR